MKRHLEKEKSSNVEMKTQSEEEIRWLKSLWCLNDL